MANDQTSQFIYTSTAPWVLGHPNLTEAKTMEKNGRKMGEPKFSCIGVLTSDHVDLAPMKGVMAACAQAMWPGIDLQTVRFPIKNGTALADKRRVEWLKKNPTGKPEDSDGEFQRGKVVLKMASKYMPALARIVNGNLVDFNPDQLALAKKELYFGVEAYFNVKFVATLITEQDANGQDIEKKYVSAYVNQVLGTGKGKQLSGGQRSASQTFAGVVGKTTQENPTLGDEIPF